MDKEMSIQRIVQEDGAVVFRADANKNMVAWCSEEFMQELLNSTNFKESDMTVWLLMKEDGSNYQVFKDKPSVEQIIHHFYYGNYPPEEVAKHVLAGSIRMGWYLTEEVVE